jgi:hypothetical protein
MRLADLIGCVGLRARAAQSELRSTAIRSMAFCDDDSELSWLATVTATADGPDGDEALVAVVEIAARPRRSIDAEGAEEVRGACRTLLAFARDRARAKARRVLAIRALRMLADRGCVPAAEIPADLDAKP